MRRLVAVCACLAALFLPGRVQGATLDARNLNTSDLPATFILIGHITTIASLARDANVPVARLRQQDHLVDVDSRAFRRINAGTLLSVTSDLFLYTGMAAAQARYRRITAPPLPSYAKQLVIDALGDEHRCFSARIAGNFSVFCAFRRGAFTADLQTTSTSLTDGAGEAVHLAHVVDRRITLIR